MPVQTHEIQFSAPNGFGYATLLLLLLSSGVVWGSNISYLEARCCVGAPIFIAGNFYLLLFEHKSHESHEFVLETSKNTKNTKI